MSIVPWKWTSSYQLLIMLWTSNGVIRKLWLRPLANIWESTFLHLFYLYRFSFDFTVKNVMILIDRSLFYQNDWLLYYFLCGTLLLLIFQKIFILIFSIISFWIYIILWNFRVKGVFLVHFWLRLNFSLNSYVFWVIDLLF